MEISKYTAIAATKKVTISNQWVFSYTFSSGTWGGRGFCGEAAIFEIPVIFRLQTAIFVFTVYLAAMALTSLIRWFGAPFASIMMDFLFFC